MVRIVYPGPVPPALREPLLRLPRGPPLPVLHGSRLHDPEVPRGRIWREAIYGGEAGGRARSGDGLDIIGRRDEQYERPARDEGDVALAGDADQRVLRAAGRLVARLEGNCVTYSDTLLRLSEVS